MADAVEADGVDAWYERPLSDFQSDESCPACGGKAFRRETDILDVWFDSACSIAALVGSRPEFGFPADLYLEGSDQHRGWFHSSLLVAVANRGAAPYRACLTHGFVVDGSGRKMSKSQGNVIDPQRVIAERGAEILRLWVAASDYREDVRVSTQILANVTENYRKVRNTIRFALGNLSDFSPGRDAIPFRALEPLDKWALSLLPRVTRRLLDAYSAYEFHAVYHTIVELCATDLSAVYFDIAKDRLYAEAAADRRRRSTQTALHAIVSALLRLFAPIMSFTAEEAWQHVPERDAASVFLTDMPVPEDYPSPQELETHTFERLLRVREAVLPAIEGARRAGLVGSSLDARVRVGAEGELAAILRAHEKELREVLIVSQVDFVEGPAAPEHTVAVRSFDMPLSVEVLQAEGGKCERCWKYDRAIPGSSGLCPRCSKLLADVSERRTDVA